MSKTVTYNFARMGHMNVQPLLFSNLCGRDHTENFIVDKIIYSSDICAAVL